MVVAFVSTTHSITSLPVESRTAAEIVAWCTSNPIYLASFIRVLLSVGVDANDQTLLQRGALLYCVLCYENSSTLTENKRFTARHDAHPIFMHHGALTAHEFLSECMVRRR